jgi:hypothetical protein
MTFLELKKGNPKTFKKSRKYKHKKNCYEKEIIANKPIRNWVISFCSL